MLAVAMKVIGGTMIIGSSAMIGFLKERGLGENIEQIQELNRVLLTIESEISYRRSTVPEILDKLIVSTENQELKQIFTDIKENLIKPNSMVDATKLALEKSKIDKRIKSVIYELFANIGNNDVEGEVNSIEFCKANLRELEVKAEEHREKYGKLYKALPLLAGTGITFILM